MSETSEAMSPLEAARVLAKARDYETDLRNRLQGVTWMIWALVSPGIFLSYAFISVADATGWWISFLWFPWILAGVLATGALWRTAALQAPFLRTMQWKAFWIRFTIIAVFYAIFTYLVPITGPAQALALVGATWLAIGFLGVARTPRIDTFGSALMAGGLTLLLGLGLTLSHLPIEVEGTLSIVASGAIPFATGLYLAHRG